ISTANVTVTHSSGSHTVHSLSASGGTFNLSGGALSVGDSLQGSDTFNLAGGTLSDATVAPEVNLRSSTSGGALRNVTLNGNLDPTGGSGSQGAYLYLYDGLTLNGTLSLGNSAGTTWGDVYFETSQTVGGSGDILLGGNGGNYLGIEGTGKTVMFGPDLTI